MTDEEYLRACGWDQRGVAFWARPQGRDAEFAEVLSVEDAVSEQLAEDRARLAFVLARTPQPEPQSCAPGFFVGVPGADVPTIATPEDARRVLREPVYAPGGAPMNASAAAIAAFKMQRPVVTVKVADPLPPHILLRALEALLGAAPTGDLTEDDMRAARQRVVAMRETARR